MVNVKRENVKRCIDVLRRLRNESEDGKTILYNTAINTALQLSEDVLTYLNEHMSESETIGNSLNFVYSNTDETKEEVAIEYLIRLYQNEVKATETLLFELQKRYIQLIKEKEIDVIV